MTNSTEDNGLKRSDEPDEDIPDRNLFMMCQALNTDAISALPDEYHVRTCRKDELELWKAMHFDTPEEATVYQEYMTDFFTRVYAPKGNLFFETCLFVCDERDTPIASAFIWKVHGSFNTIHWLKVIKAYEGQGIGRALLSIIMQDIKKTGYPVYLHTQPASYRAIKLYSDFGFHLLSDPMIGHRKNDLQECLPILKKYMTKADFANLQTTTAPSHFLKVLEDARDSQF
ncbi:MAG: GNAT family N-acetyltransferase [Chloroflexota bacterium]